MTAAETIADQLFENAFARCQMLSRDQAQTFVERGYVVIADAFPRALAEATVNHAWSMLAHVHDIHRGAPDTWLSPSNHAAGLRGYIRLNHQTPIQLQTAAPVAFQTEVDVLGGLSRLPGAPGEKHGAQLTWGNQLICHLGDPTADLIAPSCRMSGWHKDGWHFRHFLDSPEQALVVVPLFTDIEPNSGGTVLAIDSIGPVARLLAQYPAGLHPDGLQGTGYLIPGLIEQCTEFVELTGRAGDVALLHPYLLHRATVNPTARPRIIANAAPVLQQPMSLSRVDHDYSLVELATLRALGTTELAFPPDRKRQATVPRPLRTPAERRTQQRLLQAEMRITAARGVRTPDWATDYGYQSNNGAVQ